MARRYRIRKGRGKGQHYVVRSKTGQFKSFSNIGRSIRADRRQTAFTYKGKGYGHLGDAAAAMNPRGLKGIVEQILRDDLSLNNITEKEARAVFLDFEASGILSDEAIRHVRRMRSYKSKLDELIGDGTLDYELFEMSSNPRSGRFIINVYLNDDPEVVTTTPGGEWDWDIFDEHGELIAHGANCGSKAAAEAQAREAKDALTDKKPKTLPGKARSEFGVQSMGPSSRSSLAVVWDISGSACAMHSKFESSVIEVERKIVKSMYRNPWGFSSVSVVTTPWLVGVSQHRRNIEDMIDAVEPLGFEDWNEAFSDDRVRSASHLIVVTDAGHPEQAEVLAKNIEALGPVDAVVFLVGEFHDDEYLAKTASVLSGVAGIQVIDGNEWDRMLGRGTIRFDTKTDWPPTKSL